MAKTKLTLRQCVDVHNALTQIGSSGNIPTDISYLCAVNQKRLKPLVEDWKKELQILQEQYGMKEPKTKKLLHDSNGRIQFKDPDKAEKYQTLLGVLNDQENEVDLSTMKTTEFLSQIKAVKGQQPQIPSVLLEHLLDTVLLD